MHLAADGFFARQFLVRVSLLGDQLPTNRRCCQSRVQPLRLKRGIRLTLAIHNATNVDEQLGQMFFALSASPCGKRIETPDAASQFMRSFADRASIPAQLAFGAALTLIPEQPNRASHEQPPFTTFHLSHRRLQILLDRIREFHENSSSMSMEAILPG
jgi:hypothetical protein